MKVRQIQTVNQITDIKYLCGRFISKFILIYILQLTFFLEYNNLYVLLAITYV